MRPSDAPQPPQNRAPTGFSVPQLEQVFTPKSVDRRAPRFQPLRPAGKRLRDRRSESAWGSTLNRTVDYTPNRMARMIASDDLRARLGRELDALRDAEDTLYISKRGRLAGVLLDPDRYADLIERLDYLEDSLAALQARDEREQSQPWAEVRA